MKIKIGMKGIETKDMKANPVRNGVIVLSFERLPDGVQVITVPCVDYEVLSNLPMVLEYCEQLYGRTGWNSDQYIAYYRTDAKVAFSRG